MRRLLLLLMPGFLAVACSDFVGQPKAIHGENDLVAVDDDLTNLPEALHQVADAIGTATRTCTVTHLGSGVAITAGHCFYDLDDCRRQSIFWRYRGTGRETTMVSRCTDILARDAELRQDYALIKVDPIPPGRAFVAWERPLEEGETITLLSHPLGRPLEWSQYSQVEIVPPGIRHLCDTESGSSGAPLLDPETGEILAIHNDATGGATPVTTIPRETVEQALRIIARDLPPKTRDDWHLKTWTQPSTGLRWHLVALTAAEEEASIACNRVGARLPSGAELGSALQDGLRDEGANLEFGFVMKAIEWAWSTEGARRLQVSTYYLTKYPLLCVR